MTESENYRLLTEIFGALERDRKSLVLIESRVALMYEEAKRAGEVVARMKLMLDNARRMAIEQGEILQSISRRLNPSIEEEGVQRH